MRSATVKLLLAVTLVTLMITCKKEEQPDASATATDSVSVTEPSTPTDLTAARSAATANTTLTVNFFGLISQILGASNKRAVLIRNEHHEARMQLPVTRFSEAELKKIWPPADVTCGASWCTVPLQGWAVRFASKGTPITQPSNVTSDTSFDTLVPHLARVTGSSMGPTHKKFETLHSSAMSAEPPAANSRIYSWVELPPGTLSAVEYPWIAKFDPDYERTGPRKFGRDIFLSSEIEDPSIEVSKEKDKWVPIPMQGSGEFMIKILNEPHPSADPLTGTRHFPIHFELAGVPLTAAEHRPRVVLVRQAFTTSVESGLVEFVHEADRNKAAGQKAVGELLLAHLKAAEVPGCSNSQWP